MRTIMLLSTAAFLASLGAASAAPLPAQSSVGVSDGTLVQVRSDSKKKKAKKNSKGMNNMKGMDHSKMPM